MNIGPYLHGMSRFASVNGEKNRRRKPLSLRRKIINIICFVAGIAIIIAVFAMGLGQIFLIGGAFFLGICIIPTTMSWGKNLVIFETEIAANQRRADMELDFNKKKAMLGYYLMFTPLYILMLGCFFFPARQAWIVPYIPILLMSVITSVLTAHTVDTLGFNLKKYKLTHIVLHIVIFVGGLFIRNYIMDPWLVLNS